MKNKCLKIVILTALLSILFLSSYNKEIKVANAISNITNPTIKDFIFLISDAKEHYTYSDTFIESYQQTSGGYITFANKVGHTVNKSIHEPNQRFHFIESWLYQSFVDNTITWDASAETRVYKNLQCPELLLWIYEASGVDSNKVKSAYDVAVEGKKSGTVTSTIAKNMRGCVSWSDILEGLNKKDPFTPVSPITPYSGIKVENVANYLIAKKENYAISDSYIKSYQPTSGGYIDFATLTNHPINKNDCEPNQKWNFFENYIINNLKNGSLYWDGSAKAQIYDAITTPELFIWLCEGLGVDNSLINSAYSKAVEDKTNLKTDEQIVNDMRNIISWDTFIYNVKKDIEITIINVPQSISLNINDTYQLEPQLSEGSGTFTFSSEDSTIVEVTNNGLITAKSKGTSVITITNVENTEITTTTTITVNKPGPEGEEVLYSTCLFGSAYNSKSVNRYNVSWSATNNDFTWNIENFSNNSNKWDCVKTGRAGEPAIGTIKTSKAYAPAISKVIITIGADIPSDKINEIYLGYGPGENKVIQKIYLNNYSKGEYTFNISNPVINQYYSLIFDCKTAGKNGIVEIDKIEFYRKNYNNDYLADSYANIFKSITEEKCVAPYNKISSSDWSILADEYKLISNDSKNKFLAQYELYEQGQSETLYSNVFSTYTYIVRDKYYWDDFMNLGIEPNKSNHFSILYIANSPESLSIIYILSGCSLFFIALFIFKKKKIIK